MITNPQTNNGTLKKALNVIFIILGSSYGLLAVFFLFSLVSAASMPVGYGDIITLFAMPLIFLVGLLSIAYIIMVIIYGAKQFKNKMALSKLHVIAALVILIVGFLPPIGPMRILFGITFQPVIQLVSMSVKNSQFKGPTSAQIAQANLQTFDKAQALFDGCNVRSIYYWRFDTDGPFVEENSYIIVGARNNGTIDYEEAPPDVHLPISDKEKLENAMKDYSKGPYPACQLEIEWRNKNQFGS